MDVLALQRLHGVVARATAATSIDGVARVVVEEGVAALGATLGAVWLVRGDELELVHALGLAHDRYARIPLAGDAPLAACVRDRESVWVRDTADYARRFPRSHARVDKAFGCACLPLVVAGRALGGAVFAFEGTRDFAAEERDILEQIAQPCAHAIDRIRALDAESVARRHAEELARRMTALQTVSVRLAGARGLADIARVAIDDARAVIGACAVGLWRVDGDDAVMVAQEGASRTVVTAVETIPVDDRGILASALRERAPQWIGSREAAARRGPVAPDRWDGLEALAVVPLVVGGRLFGAFVLGFAQPQAFAASDREYVALFATHVALAVARDADDRAQRAMAEVEAAAARRIGKLHELSVALSSARTPAEVARATARLGCDATGAIDGAIWMAAPDGTLRMLGSNVEEPWRSEWTTLPATPELPAHRVIATGEPLWVETRHDYVRHAGFAVERARAANRQHAFALLPLVVGGARAGAITFAFAADHRFSVEERTLLAAIARGCEQAIERAQLYATADAANRAKDEFLALLGHELRNPLAPITTALDLMRLRDVAAGERERTVIERQVQHLTRLVDDLLDVSRIATGKIELRRTTDELIRAIEPAVEAVGPLLVQRRHQLRVDVPASGLALTCDFARISQVVRNLVTNAAKFTPPGGHLALSARDGGDDDGWIELTVVDDGRGIDAELLPHVFERFVQGKQGPDRAGGGLGLGLSIVKNLVELHGGTVVLASDGVGRGTRATVRLPRAGDGAPEAGASRSAGAGAGASTPAAAPHPRALRVLVVDDNIDAAMLLGDLLRVLGHAPMIAHDAPAALAVAASERPELAILDLGLPGMDGIELARRLRERDGLAQLPVIALSGYGLASDRERTRAAGFAEHLVKPVELQRLNEILGRHVRP